MKQLLQKNQSISFIIISYFLSWTCWLPIINQIQSDVFKSPPLVIALLLLGGYSPSLSAIVMARIVGGPEAVRTLLNKFSVLRVGSKWYAITLFTGPVLLFLATMIYASMGGQLGWVNYQVFLFLPVFFLVASVFGPLAEELGWRGFLLPRVDQYGLLTASLLVGLIWTFWHAPLYWAAEGTSISGMPVTFMTVGKYLIFVSGTSIIYTWVFRNTRGSVFLAFLIHMSSNGSHMAMSYLLPNIEDKRAIWNLEVWVLGLLIILVATQVVVKKLNATKQPSV